MMAFPNGNIPPERLTIDQLGPSPDEGHEDGNPKGKNLPARELGQGQVLRGGGEREAPPVHPGGIEESRASGPRRLRCCPSGPGWPRTSSSLPRSGPSATPPSSRGWGPSGSPTASSRPGGRPCGSGRSSQRFGYPRHPGLTRGTSDYCLWFSHQTCKKCVARCPVEALSEKGHDKIPCSKHVHETCKGYIVEHFGFEGYACGLCQTGVPCESKIPTPKEGE